MRESKGGLKVVLVNGMKQKALRLGEVSEPADWRTKVKLMPLADVNECYRRRRVHSAGEETRVLDEVRGDSLYLWAPGPMSLGKSEGSALALVSDLVLRLDCGSGWYVFEGTDHEQVI
jgi:hypothetical protein